MNTRLPAGISFPEHQLMITDSSSLFVYPTPPRPTSAVREAGLEHFSSIWAKTSRSTKSGSRRKGTVEDAGGFGDGPSAGRRNNVSQHPPRVDRLKEESTGLPGWPPKLA